MIDFFKGPGWLKLLRALAVIILGFLVALLVWEARENDALQAENASLQASNRQLKLNLAQERTAAATREADRQALADKNESLRRKLDEVYKTDGEAGGWADQPCPDGVVDCLLRYQE